MTKAVRICSRVNLQLATSLSRGKDGRDIHLVVAIRFIQVRPLESNHVFAQYVSASAAVVRNHKLPAVSMRECRTWPLTSYPAMLGHRE